MKKNLVHFANFYIFAKSKSNTKTCLLFKVWILNKIRNAFFSGLCAMVAVLQLLVACGQEYSVQRTVIEEWIGKKMVIPDELEWRIKGKKIGVESWTSDFKIVHFVDSGGCTSCKLKLLHWKRLIEEFNEANSANVELLVVVRGMDDSDVCNLVKRENFNHLVSIDKSGCFVNINSLPKSEDFHTFLLGIDNHVIAIGNPLTNPKIKAFYKQQISNEFTSCSHHEHDLCINSYKQIGAVQYGDSINVSFKLYNKTDSVWHLQDIVASCDCVKYDASSDVLEKNGEIEVKISTLVKDSLSRRLEYYVDVFLEERERPQRLKIEGYLN